MEDYSAHWPMPVYITTALKRKKKRNVGCWFVVNPYSGTLQLHISVIEERNINVFEPHDSMFVVSSSNSA